jgi:hypothetical protein
MNTFKQQMANYVEGLGWDTEGMTVTDDLQVFLKGAVRPLELGGYEPDMIRQGYNSNRNLRDASLAEVETIKENMGYYNTLAGLISPEILEPRERPIETPEIPTEDILKNLSTRG